MKDFFISYSDSDRAWAEWIAWRLEGRGYATVLQAWDFRPGANFVLEMQKACSETDRTLIVLSNAYLTSQFTQPEWAAAFGQDPRGSSRKLIPIRIEQCQPYGLLTAIVYLDLFDLDEAAANKALLVGVQTGRSKPRTAPIYPVTTKKHRTPFFPASEEDDDDALLSLADRSGPNNVAAGVLDKIEGDRFLRHHLDELFNKEGRSNSFICMIDIDKLTQINKLHGMDVGDEVLSRVGGMLRNTEYLRCGRCGDDTFYVLLHAFDSKEASKHAESICKTVRRYQWKSLSFDLKVTCSIGVAEFKWKEPLIDTVVRAARGLRWAKRWGNTTEFGPSYLSPYDIRELSHYYS